jgi:hypothetical protein
VTRRVLRVAAATITAVVVGALLTALPAGATPPNIPSYSTALCRLNALTVAAE